MPLRNLALNPSPIRKRFFGLAMKYLSRGEFYAAWRRPDSMDDRRTADGRTLIAFTGDAVSYIMITVRIGYVLNDPTDRLKKKISRSTRSGSRSGQSAVETLRSRSRGERTPAKSSTVVMKSTRMQQVVARVSDNHDFEISVCRARIDRDGPRFSNAFTYLFFFFFV